MQATPIKLDYGSLPSCFYIHPDGTVENNFSETVEELKSYIDNPIDRFTIKSFKLNPETFERTYGELAVKLIKAGSAFLSDAELEYALVAEVEDIKGNLYIIRTVGNLTFSLACRAMLSPRQPIAELSELSPADIQILPPVEIGLLYRQIEEVVREETEVLGVKINTEKNKDIGGSVFFSEAQSSIRTLLSTDVERTKKRHQKLFSKGIYNEIAKDVELVKEYSHPYLPIFRIKIPSQFLGHDKYGYFYFSSHFGAVVVGEETERVYWSYNLTHESLDTVHDRLHKLVNFQKLKYLQPALKLVEELDLRK